MIPPMLARALDRTEDFAARHATAIAILAALWFWLGVAITARFIRLPQIDWPFAEPTIFWSGVVVNASWWGFLRPSLERRRQARQARDG